jgi:glycosyltransferase involved in cell wall biosynthesis
MRGYDFADQIVVSDGGSMDRSVEMLLSYPKVKLIFFNQTETVNGETWNPDNQHANFVINAAKELEPDWLILDDMDDVPNYLLRENARLILETCGAVQVNAYRIYLWGSDQYFPQMNNYFASNMKSLWAWNPKWVDVRADETKRHGTYLGIHEAYHGIDVPMCLLHKSWHPDTIEAKMARYNKLGIEMRHPIESCGPIQKIEEWMVE